MSLGCKCIIFERQVRGRDFLYNFHFSSDFFLSLFLFTFPLLTFISKPCFRHWATICGVISGSILQFIGCWEAIVWWHDGRNIFYSLRRRCNFTLTDLMSSSDAVALLAAVLCFSPNHFWRSTLELIHSVLINTYFLILLFYQLESDFIYYQEFDFCLFSSWLKNLHISHHWYTGNGSRLKGWFQQPV